MPDNNSLTHGFRMAHESHASLEKKAGVFIRLNKTVGPFGAVLFFFALAVCTALTVIAIWFRADVAKPIVDGHLEYLKQQNERAKTIEGTQVSIKDALEATVQQLTGLNEATEKTHQIQRRTQDLLEAQTEWHRRAVEETRKTNQLLQTGRIKVSNGPETVDGKSPLPMGSEPN